jgi:hypothetical protein
MEVSVEKPGSPADILEHFGTKGMKWGVRKSVDTAIGTKTAGRKKPLTANQRFNRQNPTSRQKAQAIRTARASTELDRTKFVNEPKGPKRVELKKAYLKNPDRATALRMTRGEKAVTALVTVGLIPATAGISVPAVALGGAAQIGIRKNIERRQAKRAFG